MRSLVSPTSEECEPRTLGRSQNLLSWAGSARKAHHTRIPGANLAKNAAEEAGRDGGGASRRAALNGVARDSPGLVRQGVGVLTSAIAARVESKQVNGGGSAKERQPGHSAVTVGILLCPGLNGTEHTDLNGPDVCVRGARRSRHGVSRRPARG